MQPSHLTYLAALRHHQPTEQDYHRHRLLAERPRRERPRVALRSIFVALTPFSIRQEPECCM